MPKYVIKVDGEEIDHADSMSDAERARNTIIYGEIGTEANTTIEDAPAEPLATFRARAIVTQDGTVDIPWNRTDYTGDPAARQKLSGLLSDGIGKRATDRVKELLLSFEMQTRKAQEFTVFEDEQVQVLANTNASGGYCYIVATLKQMES